MKFHYDESERICSDDFDPSLYWNREELRKYKKEVKTAQTGCDLTELFKIINDSGFIEIYELCDYVNEHEPGLRDTLFQNFYQLKSYIDSKHKMQELKSKYLETIKRLELDNKILRRQALDEKETAKALTEENERLRRYVMEFEDGSTLLQILDLGLDDSILISDV